jgi:hypothetical protein
MPPLPIAPETDALLQAELSPGERILWSSAPIRSRILKASLPLILIGLLFTGFAFLSVARPSGAFPMGPLFSDAALAPFFLFGTAGLALLVVSPLAAMKMARRTGYAITTDRVLAAEAVLFGPTKLRSYPASRLGAAQLDLKPDGSGSIILETIVVRGGRHGPRQRRLGLLNIPDARAAHETILELAKDVPQEPAPPLPSMGGQRWVAPILIAVGGLVLLACGATDLIQGRRSAHWPVAPGTVLHAGILRRTGRRVTYQAQIVYQFEVDGRVYHGNRVSYGDHSASNQHAHELTARYRQGTMVTVSYDPAHPDTAAVLEPGVAPLSWSYPGFCALLAAVGLTWGIFQARQQRLAGAR